MSERKGAREGTARSASGGLGDVDLGVNRCGTCPNDSACWAGRVAAMALAGCASSCGPMIQRQVTRASDPISRQRCVSLYGVHRARKPYSATRRLRLPERIVRPNDRSCAIWNADSGWRRRMKSYQGSSERGLDGAAARRSGTVRYGVALTIRRSFRACELRRRARRIRGKVPA